MIWERFGNGLGSEFISQGIVTNVCEDITRELILEYVDFLYLIFPI